MDNSEKILVTSALPYANGSIHLGHLVEYIQTYIFVRFLKLIGKDAIYLCADDTHETPIYIKAKSLNITPEELISKYSEEHQKDFVDFQIEFDYYYSTHSPENEKHSIHIYNQLKKNNHIITKNVEKYYCETDTMFLSDRFIKGTCPNCKTIDQYGDVCESCGFHYDSTDLINPYCSVCNSTPVLKESEHYFFKLSDFIGNPMTTVLTLNESAKMNDRTISDKPCLPSFAKAKEKQHHTQANASCFTFAFAPTHQDNYLRNNLNK